MNDTINRENTLKEHSECCRKSWQAFVMSGNLPLEGKVSPEILSSWMRCKERGVSSDKQNLQIISERELAKRKKKLSEIILITESVCNEIFLEDDNFTLDLFDADLYLIASFGNKKNPILREGMCAAEQYGTNAVNLAKLLEKPMQLAGYEHYNKEYHEYVTTAVDMHDMNGEPIAVFSTCTELSDAVSDNLISLLVLIRRIVKYKLNANLNIKQDVICNHIVENMQAPFIVIGAGGTVLYENKAAAAFFNGKYRSIIGFSIDAIFGVERNPFKEVLYSKHPIKNKELVFYVSGKVIRLKGSITPIFSDDNKLMAISGSFSQIERTNKQDDAKKLIDFTDIIGNSMQMKQTVFLARKTAHLSSNVLIEGETGTGKDLFAQAIHRNSMYSEGPFVAINCAAIPENLLESELFGYEGGAFTGAKREGQIGKFEAARGGTIFLDEINAMPLSMQVKLLRAIQNKSVMRVGGSEEIPINVRIITASNVSLWSLVKSGKFREDLFYRVNVIMVTLPPLRERVGDIELLIGHITSKLAGELDMRVALGREPMEVLRNYSWPGNVRELENVVEKGCIMALSRGSEIIELEDILSYEGIKDYINSGMLEKTLNVYAPPNQNAVLSLDEIEKNEIMKALERNNGNVSQSAKDMGIARNTFYNKMKKYNITVPK